MNLREFAKAQKMVSPLMENRDKIDTKDVIGQELTLIDFDIVQTGMKPYSVCVFREYPDKFLFGGTVMTDLLFKISEEYGENYSAELDAVDGLKLRLKTVVAKKRSAENGMFNSYTDVEIL